MPRTRESQDRHNELRRKTREKGRQDTFLIDYIQTTYPEIYNEAEGFHNVLKSRYPNKVDLKKTSEYKSFKKLSRGEGSQSGEHFYFDVRSAMVMLRPQPPQTSPQPPQTSPQPPETSPQAPETSPQPPEMSPQPPETSPQAPETSPQPPETSPPSTETQQPTTNHKRIMELRIPLMSPDMITQTVTDEEIVQGNVITAAGSETLTDDISSLLSEEIPQDVYEAILKELRHDPELSKILDDIELDTCGMESDLELSTCDMDIDLPSEDDRLEQELYNFW